MRRIIGIVLIGLGVAALTLAVLLRTYAYPAVSKVTAEFPTAESKAENPKAGTTVSTGDGVQVFVVRPSGVGPRTDQITFTRTTIGDVSRAQGDYVFWETRSEGRAASVTDGPLSIGIDGICVHR
jgi:hypothetical protein